MANTYLTAEEAAAVLRVAPRTLIQWAVAGRVPAAKTPGGHWRFLAADLMLSLEPALAPRRGDGKRGRH